MTEEESRLNHQAMLAIEGRGPKEPLFEALRRGVLCPPLQAMLARTADENGASPMFLEFHERDPGKHPQKMWRRYIRDLEIREFLQAKVDIEPDRKRDSITAEAMQYFGLSERKVKGCWKGVKPGAKHWTPL